MSIKPPDGAELNPEPSIEPAQPEPSPAPAAPRPFSILALFGLIGGLLMPSLACLGSVMIGVSGANVVEAPLFISILLSLGLAGLPLAWEAFQRLRGGPARPWTTSWTWIAVSAVVILVVLSAGQALVGFKVLPAYVAGLAQPIVFVAAAAAVLALAGSGWSGISRLRAWGQLLFGAWLSVFLAFIVEIIVIGLLGLAVLVVLAAVAPAQAQALMATLRSLRNDPNPDALMAWLHRPWVIGLAYLIASVLIPLIEELIKSLGVALFIGRRPAPMAAFMGGLMGGVGFAVTESLSNLVNLANPWAVLVLARLGTLAMHGFTSSLVGWGWGQLAGGRPGRFGLAYLGAVAMHGLWNAAVVTMVVGGLTVVGDSTPSTPQTMLVGVLIAACVLLLVALVPACLVSLAVMGRRLQVAPIPVNIQPN
jgi:hypothetical protein